MKEKKVVLITGASSGIGYETAKKFLKQKHIVYGVARRTELMKELEDIGGHTFFMDVRDDKSVKEGIKKIIKEQEKIDVLINNAGYARYGSVEDVSIKQAKEQFETNVFGYARVIKEVLPQMRKQKSGIIINVTSSAGKINGPFVTWYGSSKFALEGLLDALRNETKSLGIKIVIIEPGFIKTNLYKVAWKFLQKVKISQVYKDMIKSFKKNFQKREAKAPTPEIIAEKIYKITLTKNPKTRYVLTKDARFFLFMRKILSDKMFDRLVLRSLEIN